MKNGSAMSGSEKQDSCSGRGQIVYLIPSLQISTNLTLSSNNRETFCAFDNK